jgi:hypothetical protein
LSGFFLESRLYAGKRHRVFGVEGQYFTTLQKLNDEESKWADDWEALLRQRQKGLDSASGTNTTRLQKFDALVPSEIPPDAVRLSADLLDLREREKHLIGSRRFDEAAQLHKAFRERQHDELLQRREEYFNKLEHQREQVVSRNKHAYACQLTFWERRINKFRSQMDTALAPLREAVARLLKKLVETKSEYIGYDDPIIHLDTSLVGPKITGNFQAVKRPQTQRYGKVTIPRSIAGTCRPVSGARDKVPVRRLSASLHASVFEPDSRRWP